MYYLNNPVFRYEKPQAGRLREHHQFGMECFGGKEPTVEAELIATLLGILGDLGLKGLSVNINSIGCPTCRAKYHAALKAYFDAHYNGEFYDAVGRRRECKGVASALRWSWVMHRSE